MARLRPIGWQVLAGSSLILLAGIALGYPELRLIGAAGFASLLSGLIGGLGRLRMEVHREVEPERVERNEVALGLVEVHNPSSRRTRPAAAIDHAGPDEFVVPLPALAPGERKSRTYRLASSRRGLIPVGPLTLERTDPLQCWTNVQELGEARTLVVTPRVLPFIGVPKGRTRSLDAPTIDNAPNGTVVFHTLRKYVPGDERRHIHWKASAKTGVLQVKQHVDTSEPNVSVVLATSAAAFPDAETFEEAADVAASIAVSLTGLRFPVRIVTPGHRTAAVHNGTTERAVVLDHLAAMPDRQGPTTAPVLIELARDRVGDAVILVTGTIDDESTAALVRLQRRYSVVVLVSVRPDALSSPIGPVPGVVVIQGCTADELATLWSRAFASRRAFEPR